MRFLSCLAAQPGDLPGLCPGVSEMIQLHRLSPSSSAMASRKRLAIRDPWARGRWFRGRNYGGCPLLLFVHTGLRSFIWRDVMTRLSADFLLHLSRCPRHRESDRVPKRAITLDNSSHAVTAVIERLDLENLTIVVHDLGGFAGLTGAARTPERVRGIAAINTFGRRCNLLLKASQTDMPA